MLATLPTCVDTGAALAGTAAGSGTRPAPAANEADGPLRTLEGARDAVRALKAANNGLPGPVTIRIQSGDWYLGEPLRLTPEERPGGGGKVRTRAG
jgi:hypothetical protein